MKHSAFNDDNPGAQLGITFLFIFTGLIVISILSCLFASLIFGINFSALQDLTDFSNQRTIQISKFLQIFISVGLFIVIPLILSRLFSGNSFGYLKVNTLPSFKKLGIVVLVMITAIPAVNLIAGLNAQIRFPAFMSGIEKVMMDNEKVNDNITEAFLNVSTLPGLIVNIFMFGFITAIGEEFLFRGILQRILTNLAKNSHWGIIISGFIFSAIHMQFYGFFPRWLLGIMFGYMFVWSGSLWLPILAHFINNSLDVIACYFINAKMLNPKILDIGSTNEFLPLTAVTTIILGFGLYWLFRNRQTVNSEQ